MLAPAPAPLLAALLAPGDPLVTLIRPLAALVALAILAGLASELRRKASARSDGEAPPGPPLPTLLLAALLLLLGERAFGLWLPVAELAALDTFEALRAAGVAALGFGALALGLAWPRTLAQLVGRVALVLSLGGGLVLTALAIGGDLGPGAGLLGNTGYDLQVLLPGAVLGLLLAARAEYVASPMALLGAGAFLATAWFAALTPVVGGVLVLGLFGLLALSRATSRRHVAGLLLAGLGVLPLGLLGDADGSAGSAGASSPAAPTTVAADLGGVGVRLAIWGSLGWSSPHMGVGQFQREYPPLRDADELTATTGGQTVAEVREVEHPHNDYLLWLAESGTGGALALVLLALLGGAVWFQLLVRRRWQAADLEPLAAGALALPVGGLFHAPLLVNPLAALLGWSLLGALLGRLSQWRGPAEAASNALTLDRERVGRGGDPVGRFVVPVVALLWLGPLLGWSPLDDSDLAAGTPADLASPRSARLAADGGRLPYGVVAAHARSLETADPTDAAAFWDLALDLRPHAVEALIQRGKLDAAAGDLDGAEARWLRADALYPGYGPLGANLRRLGADLVLAGALERGLARLQPALDELDVDPAQGREPAVLLQVARLLEAEAPSIERAALASAAHWLQARRLAEADLHAGAAAALGRAAGAAARELAGAGPEDLVLDDGAAPAAPAVVDRAPATLQVELAACEAAAGDPAAARSRLARLAPDAAPEASAPAWVAASVDLLRARD